LQGLSPNDTTAQKLHTELRAAYRQQLARIVAAQQQQTPEEQQQQEPESTKSAVAGTAGTAGGDDAAEPAAAAATGTAAATEVVPKARFHRIVITESDGSASDSDGDDSSTEEGEVLLELPGGMGGTYTAAVAAQVPAAVKPAAQVVTQLHNAPAATGSNSSSSSKPAPQRALTAPKTTLEFVTTAKSLLSPGYSVATAAAAAAVKGPGAAASRVPPLATALASQNAGLGLGLGRLVNEQPDITRTVHEVWNSC